MPVTLLSTVATTSAAVNPFAGFDWSGVAYQGFALLSTLLSIGLGWLGLTVGQWVRAKTKSEVAGRLTDQAFQIVSEIQQTVVAAIRDAAADGIITAAEKVQIKDAALAVFRKRLGPQGIKEIKGVLGIEVNALDDYLGGLIEAAVHKLKILAPAPVPVFGPPVEGE